MLLDMDISFIREVQRRYTTQILELISQLTPNPAPGGGDSMKGEINGHE